MCLGIPGQVMTLDGEHSLTRTGKVRFGAVTKDVNLAYTPEVQCGDYVIVHVGFAISILNEEEANRILATLEQLFSEDLQ